MRMFIIFVASTIVSLFLSYICTTKLNKNVPPSVFALAFLVLWIVLPEKWINKINGTKNDDQ